MPKQNKNKFRVLGIMSGTSLDGVDFVLCEVQKDAKDHVKIRYLSQAASRFPQELEARLHSAARRESKVDELANLHHDLGKFYARQVLHHQKKLRWKIDLVGLHGQTIFHNPPHSTLQIGEPSYLAQALDCPVVSDFRVADLALGGEAAPLAPLFHWVAFADLAQKSAIAVHNLGGISNVTYLPRRAKSSQIIAFDTGPSNMLIDLATRQLSGGKMNFDAEGAWAAKGLPEPQILKKWMKHPYFQKKPPKSTGREEFGENFFQKAMLDFAGEGVHRKEDQLNCLTELTAQSIAHAYRKFLPSLPGQALLCGGGAKNSTLVYRLKYWLPEVDLHTTADFGWPESSIEGGAFALLAAFRYWDLPANLPSVTGASRAVVLGKIS